MLPDAWHGTPPATAALVRQIGQVGDGAYAPRGQPAGEAGAEPQRHLMPGQRPALAEPLDGRQRVHPARHPGVRAPAQCLEHGRDIGPVMLERELHQPVAQGQDPLHRLMLGQHIVIVRIEQVAIGDIDWPHALGIGPNHGKFGSGELGGGQRVGIRAHEEGTVSA
ncbi:hypothetical protein D3C85_1249320 [compost metagenome]